MKVGFGTKDITPRVGVQLYGFGPFINRDSLGIRDRLEARASYFEGDNGGRFLIITCDLCTLQPHTCDTIREIICEKVPSLKPSEIMVECALRIRDLQPLTAISDGAIQTRHTWSAFHGRLRRQE